MTKVDTTTIVDYIDRVRSGQATIDDCLASQPEQTAEIEALLRLAVAIQAPQVTPSMEFHTRTRAILSSQPPPCPGFLGTLQYLFGCLPTIWPSQLSRLTVATVVSLVLLVFVGTTGVVAAQQALPGDSLYAVKLFTEEAHLLMARTDIDKAEVHISLAERRAKELNKLVAGGQTEAAEMLLAAYMRHLKQMEELAFLEPLDNGQKTSTHQMAITARLVASEEALTQVQRRLEQMPTLDEALARTRLVLRERHRPTPRGPEDLSRPTPGPQGPAAPAGFASPVMGTAIPPAAETRTRFLEPDRTRETLRLTPEASPIAPEPPAPDKPADVPQWRQGVPVSTPGPEAEPINTDEEDPPQGPPDSAKTPFANPTITPGQGSPGGTPTSKPVLPIGPVPSQPKPGPGGRR
jgi:hypothetical protein